MSYASGISAFSLSVQQCHLVIDIKTPSDIYTSFFFSLALLFKERNLLGRQRANRNKLCFFPEFPYIYYLLAQQWNGQWITYGRVSIEISLYLCNKKLRALATLINREVTVKQNKEEKEKKNRVIKSITPGSGSELC